MSRAEYLYRMKIMVIRLLPIAMMLVASVLSLGCTTIVTSESPSESALNSTIPNTVSGSALPDDFYIIYEEMYTPRHGYVFSSDKFDTKLNTKDNIVGFLAYEDNELVWNYYHYRILSNDLQDIYDALIEYDFKSYSSNPDLLTDESLGVGSLVYYRVTFRLNAEIYSITFGENALWILENHEPLEAFKRILDDKYNYGHPRPS